MRGGILSKARRGELITPLPIGLAYDAAGPAGPDPDTSIQQAVTHLFTTFTATGSAHAVVKTFNDTGLLFPRRHRKGPRKGELDWAPLAHSAVLRILHNPRYAGVFCFGRHRDHADGDGTYIRQIKPREEWISFIPGAHPGYITVDEFEANQIRLAECAAAHGTDRRKGPPREGPALLQGIIICGRRGNRMTVRYHVRHGLELPDYVCQRAMVEHADQICQALPGASLDAAIGQLITGTLTPLAAEAALTVAAELEQRADYAGKLRAAAVERARYHADLTRRRYLAVDPANRLVADTLEADWNTALRALNDAKDAYGKAQNAATANLGETQKTRIRKLVTDFPAIWNDPATPQRERKRMTRLLLTDVTVTRNAKTITCNMRWQGGQDHTITLPVPKTAWELRQTPPHVVQAIDQLLDHHTHAEIAAILNARGHTSGEGRPFHPLIVRNIRDEYGLRGRQQRLRDAGMLTLTRWPAGSACPPAPSRHGATPVLSVARATTIKARRSTTHPDPTPQHGTKESRSALAHQPKPQKQPNQPEEVQCETKGFILGAWGAVGSVVIPIDANTASNAAVNFASRSRIRYVNRHPACSRSSARLRASWVPTGPSGAW
jgi:cell division septation protein DedD